MKGKDTVALNVWLSEGQRGSLMLETVNRLLTHDQDELYDTLIDVERDLKYLYDELATYNYTVISELDEVARQTALTDINPHLYVAKITHWFGRYINAALQLSELTRDYSEEEYSAVFEVGRSYTGDDDLLIFGVDIPSPNIVQIQYARWIGLSVKGMMDVYQDQEFKKKATIFGRVLAGLYEWHSLFIRIRARLDTLTFDRAITASGYENSAGSIKKDLANSSQNANQSAYRSFSDLFKRPEDEARCVNALSKYRPEKPVINGANQWIGNQGKDKGVIVAWIEAMERSKPSKIALLTGTTGRKQLVQLLNDYFPGLDMGKDARVFSDPADSKIIDTLTSLI